MNVINLKCRCKKNSYKNINMQNHCLKNAGIKKFNYADNIALSYMCTISMKCKNVGAKEQQKYIYANNVT